MILYDPLAGCRRQKDADVIKQMWVIIYISFSEIDSFDRDHGHDSYKILCFQ